MGWSELTQVTAATLVAADRRCFEGPGTRRVMQHASSDDVQNAEASQHSDRPRLELWRWSPGVGAIGNSHIKIAFLYAFEGKLFVLIARCRIRSAAVQARPVAVKDIAGLIRERYGRCRISSSVSGPMSKRPPQPQAISLQEISAANQSQPWPGDRQSRSSIL
jgi:hypothetical protein